MTPRLLSTVLLVPLLACLGACDGKAADTPVAAAPSAIATSASSQPPAAADDADVCAKVDVAFNDFTSTVSASIGADGKVPAPAAKKAFGDLAATLAELSESGQPASRAAQDLRAFSAEATRVAKLADPLAGKVGQRFDKAAGLVEKDCAAAKR